MILPNRPYKREAPSKDAKSVFIFCEGKRREYQYFRYFRELDTRINIEVYELHEHEDNSPLGLFNIAKESIIKSDDNPDPKYNFIEGDEVWIVFDRDLDKLDSRAPQIAAVKESCSKTDGWNHAISNPCFEVWLYYHEYSDMPNDMSASPSWWKQLVADNIKSGFDSRRHPLLIETARNNSKKNFKLVDDIPDIGCTEVHRLADTILPLVKGKLDKVLNEIS